MALDIVFMGTPEFSVPVLDALCASGHRIVAVYSQPPRPAGRGMSEIKSPVQRRVEALGLPVRTPLNFKGDAERADFAALKADAEGRTNFEYARSLRLILREERTWLEDVDATRNVARQVTP